MTSGPSSRGGQAFDAAFARIESVLETRAVEIVFQPVVDIRRGETVGVEALARFAAEPRRGPDVWFLEAWKVGLGLELELLAIDLALARLPELPADVYVAVNTDPRTLVSPELALRLVDPRICERVVLEVTEHAPVADYATLVAALAPLRNRGVRLATDDTGAGFASLQHVLELCPDIVKLDRSITRQVDDNPVRRALAAGLVTFADSLHATICAEGVETESQLVALQKIGIGTAQGYYLARPGPLPLPNLPAGIWPSRPERRSGAPASGVSPAVRAPSRLEALLATGLLDSDEERAFARITELAMDLVGSEVALVSLVDDRRQFFKSAIGLPEPWASRRETPLTHSFCQHAVTTRLPLVIEDARSHPLVRDNGATTEIGVGAYLGIPLVTSADEALGSFCAIQTTARSWSEANVATMKKLAALVVELIESRRELRRSQERAHLHELVVEAMPTASALVDLDGTIVYANHRFAGRLGFEPGALLGASIRGLVDEGAQCALRAVRGTLLAGERASAALTTRLLTREGDAVAVTLHWTMLREDGGAARCSLLTLESEAHVSGPLALASGAR